MFSFPRLGQQEFRTTANDADSMLEKLLQHLLDGERQRPLADKGQHDDADCRLKRREPVKLIEDDVGILTLFQHDVETNLPSWRLAVGEVNDAGDALHLLIADEQLKLLADAVPCFEVRNFGDDDDVAGLFFFEVRLRAKRQC